MLQELYDQTFGVIQFPAGNTGTQMGGWFRERSRPSTTSAA